MRPVILALVLAGCSPAPPPPPATPTPTPVAETTPKVITPPAGARVIAPGPKWQEEAIQELNAHGTAYLGPGNFTTPSFVLMMKAHLVGAGPDQTRIVSPGSQAVFTVMKDTTLEHLTISHEGDKAAYLVRAANCTLTMDDCRLTGAHEHALVLFGHTRSQLANCEFTDNLKYGVEQAEGSSATATNCIFSGHGGVSWACDVAANTTLTGCTFAKSRYAGVYFVDKGQKVVNNCTFRDCQEEGVVVGNQTTVTVTNSTFESVQVNGIEVHGTAHLVNNTVKGSRTGIIYSDDADGEADGNSCTDCVLSGIEAGGKAHPKLTRNTCARNGQAGISYWQNAAGEALNNVLEGNPQGGIVIELPSNPKIGANEFKANGQGEVVRL